MSELMKRYELEKFEKNLPKEKISTKQIIIAIMSFLFLLSVLFITYIINHDIDIINLGNVAEFILKNPPLFIGSVIFVFTFIFTSLITLHTNDILDIFASLISSIIVSLGVSAIFYFITYIVTFRWV